MLQTSASKPGRDELAIRLTAAIAALVRRFSIAERAEIACCGTTVAQAATLTALANGPLRLGELGRRLGIAPSTLSRNLDRLEERGLVERGPDPGDRRALRAELTDAGRQTSISVREQEIEFARSVLGRLPASDAPTAVEALEKLFVAIRSASDSCCPRGLTSASAAGRPSSISACGREKPSSTSDRAPESTP
jgi:DNA-binding MarR family transcriptional regulator